MLQFLHEKCVTSELTKVAKHPPLSIKSPREDFTKIDTFFQKSTIFTKCYLINFLNLLGFYSRAYGSGKTFSSMFQLKIGSIAAILYQNSYFILIFQYILNKSSEENFLSFFHISKERSSYFNLLP